MNEMNELNELLLLYCGRLCVVDRLGGDVHARDRDGCDNVVWSRLGLDDRRVLGHFDRSRLIFPQHPNTSLRYTCINLMTRIAIRTSGPVAVAVTG